MKVRCSREDLLNAWAIAGAVVPPKPIRPVLSHIKVSAGDDGLTLFTTDMNIGVRFLISEATIEEAGEVLIPAALMGSILRDGWGDEVSIISEKDSSEIILAESRFQIMGESADNYPEAPSFDTKSTFTLPRESFSKMVELTRFAVAREDTRYTLNGIYLEIRKNTALMVATDGRRLSRAEAKLAANTKTTGSAIVPVAGLDEVSRCFTDDDKEVVLSLSENMLQAQTKKATVFTKLIEGTFPNYEEVIPKNNDKNALLNAADLLVRLRQAAKLTSEDSRAVKLSFENNKLTMSSSSPEVGEATIEMAIRYSGEKFEIRFNPAYLVDVLRALSSAEISFEFSEPSRPGLISRDKEFTYVLMPVNID